MIKNQYGEFTEKGTYIITNPDTPTKWENKLFNDEYVLDITQRLEGKSYIVDEYRQTQILAFERRFYLSIGGKAVRLFCGFGNSYQAEYDIDKMTVTEEFDDFCVKAEVTVPEKGKQEFWKFSLENKSDKDNIYNLFCLYPFVNNGPMGGEVSLSKNKRYVSKFSFPYHVKYEDKERVEKNNGYTFVMADCEIESFDGNAQAFYGSDNIFALPDAVKNECCSNTKGQGDYLDAAVHIKKDIKNGSIVEVTFIIGSAKTVEEIEQLSCDMPVFDIVYDRAKKYRKEKYTGYEINTPDKTLNYMFNKWLVKQMVYLARMNRGGVYCPVRNQLQDALGYSMIDPYGALGLALKVLRRQHTNGYLKQWYMTDGSPERDLCKINHSDACIWLILCVTEIINNCGDIKIFEQMESYIDSDVKESILTHLKKAILYMASLKGQHGLCLMLDGDWTDPINGAGRYGKGESVWNSMALVYAIHQVTEIFPDSELEKIADDLKIAVNEHCWDGEWYIAGFDDESKPFGSSQDKEGRLFLNTQTWSLISGIVPEERVVAVKESIDKLKVPFGWLILDKPFDKWNDTWGRISIKQKGTTENGSVYCHATMFKALADCISGDKEAALDAVMRTLPTNPENPTEKNLQLPLYVPNYYFGINNENFGKSSCNFGTGTTAWLIWVMIKHILGIKTDVNGIKQSDEYPKALEGSTVMRKFKDEEFVFRFEGERNGI